MRTQTIKNRTVKNENLNGRYTAEIRKIQIELFEEIGPDIYKDLFTMDLRKICDQIHNGSVLIEFTQIYREIEKNRMLHLFCILPAQFNLLN